MFLAKHVIKGGKHSMSIEMKTQYGQIDITNDVIAMIAGGAAVDCYGIVGMASKNQIKDGFTDICVKRISLGE